MAETTKFRTATEPVAQQAPAAPQAKPTTHQATEVEVPFTSYEEMNGKPYLVNHYQLGDDWNDSYGEEADVLNTYLSEKIRKGELADSIPAVKEEIKSLERVNGIKKEERTVIRVGVLAAYARFLLEMDGIKQKVRKYANN